MGNGHMAGTNALARKGTGFVAAGELPPSDDEDEDDEEKPRGDGPKGHAKISDNRGDGNGSLARKGTGFVSAADLPDEDEDEEEDEKKNVQFDTPAAGAGEQKP